MIKHSRSAVGDSGGDLRHAQRFRPDQAGEAVPRAVRHAGVGTVRYSHAGSTRRLSIMHSRSGGDSATY